MFAQMEQPYQISHGNCSLFFEAICIHDDSTKLNTSVKLVQAHPIHLLRCIYCIQQTGKYMDGMHLISLAVKLGGTYK